MSYINKSLTSILLAGFLIGCGSSSEPAATLSKLSGVAVDDLIVNGDVVVYPAGDPANILKRGKTDSTSGAYTLEVAHDGLVVVEVTCGSTGKMKNPQTGEMRECESGLKLHSAASISSKVPKIEVNISPLTDAVVVQMKANGGDKAAFEAAQSNIGEMFGFDPIAKNPVKDTTYAKTVASIRALADDKNVSVMKIVDNLNDDLSDGEAGDDGTIAFELAEVMKEKKVNTKFAQNDGVVKPDTKVTKSDIEVAKAFFTELRTEAMSVIDYDKTGTDGFLDKEAKDLGDVLKNETLNVNSAGKYATDVITGILKAIDNNETSYDYQSASVTKKSANEWSYTIQDASGTVTLPSETIKDITPASFTTLEAKFEGTLPLEEDGLPAAQGVDSQNKVARLAAVTPDLQNAEMDVVLKKTSDGASLNVKKLSLTHGSASVVFSDLTGQASYDYDASKPEDETLTAHFIQFDGGKIVGKVDGYELNGELSIPEYVVNDSIKDEGWESKIYNTHVSTNVVCTDTDNHMSVSDATVTYIDKSGVEHNLTSRGGGYYSAHIDGNVEQLDDHSSYNNSYGAIGAILVNIQIQTPSCTNPRVQYLNIYNESDSSWYNSGKLPKKASFTGSIKNTNTQGEISGKLTADWIDAATLDIKAEDRPQVKVSLVGKIKMPQRPEMTLNLGYENPNNKNNLTFSYAYDATTINGTGSLDRDGKNGTVTLTTHEGLKFHMKIADGKPVYGDASPVTRNGRRVGTLEERESAAVIKYTDDTFESLL